VAVLDWEGVIRAFPAEPFAEELAVGALGEYE
jgi:hypothetical protein